MRIPRLVLYAIVGVLVTICVLKLQWFLKEFRFYQLSSVSHRRRHRLFLQERKREKQTHKLRHRADVPQARQRTSKRRENSRIAVSDTPAVSERAPPPKSPVSKTGNSTSAGPFNVAAISGVYKTAGRQIVYAEVPKTGSTSFEILLRATSAKNGLVWRSEKKFRFHTGYKMLKQFSDTFFPSDSAIPTAFMSHIRFINFNQFNRSTPVWISLVREPAERFVSRFYYRRKHPLIAKEHFRKFGKEKGLQWQEGNFTHCFKNRQKDCVVGKGTMYEPSPITYFCGYASYCSKQGSYQALAQAKSNVEAFFPVVGVLEKLKDSLEVFEHRLPMFLTGLTKIEVPRANAVARKDVITPEIRNAIRKMFELEYDLYDYLCQRLSIQIAQMKRNKTRNK